MFSMYKEYIKEREDADLVHDEKGFATFKYMDDNSVYIIDIYVRKEYRKEGIASKYADMIVEQAKERGCKFVLGTVSENANNSETSKRVLEAYGMRYLKDYNDLKWYVKEIK